MKNICVFAAASSVIDEAYLDASYEIGRLIAENGYGLVYGGGGEGAMGCIARGAHDAGGKITGIVPDYLNVDGVIFKNCTELIVIDTLRNRKKIMDDLSDVVIAMPGGIGTIDEFMEMLALRQLCRHEKPVILVNTNNYYYHLIEMLKECIEQKFAKPESKDLFYVAKTPLEAIEYIKSYKPSNAVVKKLRYIGEETQEG